MKILFLGKFPPIKGGESVKAYWLFKSLIERHEIKIISIENLVDNKYKHIDNNDLLHNTFDIITVTDFNSSTISQPNLIDSIVLEKAIEVLNDFKADIIFSWYFFPFASVANSLKNIFNIPWVFQHAGSDTKLLNDSFPLLKEKILSNADGLLLNNLNFNDYEDFLDTHSINYLITKTTLSNDFIDEDVLWDNNISFEKKSVLFVGTIYDKKNFRVLYNASQKANIPLTCAGVSLNNDNEFNGINILGYISNYKMPYLYRNTLCNVIPETNDFNVNGHLNRSIFESISCGQITIVHKDKKESLPMLLRDKVLYFESENELSELLKDIAIGKYIDFKENVTNYSLSLFFPFDEYVSEIETFLEKISK